MSTELQRRVKLMKRRFIEEHREAPIALYLTRSDEDVWLAESGLAANRATARKRIRRFLGLQVIWDADETKIG